MANGECCLIMVWGIWLIMRNLLPKQRISNPTNRILQVWRGTCSSDRYNHRKQLHFRLDCSLVICLEQLSRLLGQNFSTDWFLPVLQSENPKKPRPLHWTPQPASNPRKSRQSLWIFGLSPLQTNEWQAYWKWNELSTPWQPWSLFLRIFDNHHSKNHNWVLEMSIKLDKKTKTQ